MHVSILGINHKTAPVSVREQVAFSVNDIQTALLSIKHAIQLDEVVIISTCNRMEIVYIQQSSNAKKVDLTQISSAKKVIREQVLSWLISYHQLSLEQLEPHYYHHHGQEAIKHLMSVASGLDSMVLGEPQILGQVKDGYGYASNAGTIGLYLNRLFQQTFTLAKQVRTDTQIGESAVSVAYAAITLAKRIFDDFSQINVLFIGAGETIELAARHLVRQGVINIHVANRTVERAQILASEFSAQAYSLTSLPELIEKADIVISSTASPVPIIGKGLMEKAIAARKHRSMFMVDLAVPRDIEPEVATLSDVYLYTVDDMQNVIQENLKVRETAAKEAEAIVSLHTEKYLSWMQSLSSVSLLKEFRSQVEQTKLDEVERAIAKLNFSDQTEQDKTEEIIYELANRMAQKFMHQPSQVIRKAGEAGDQKTLQILSGIFGLSKN